MPEPKKQTVLLIEDVKPQAEIFSSYLKMAGYDVVLAQTGNEALAMLEESQPDAIVLDLHLPDMNGMNILRKARERYPQIPVVVATADTSAQAAIDAINAGAYDFILKPFPAPRLVVTLHNALERNSLQREVVEWRQTLGQKQYLGFVGQSPAMQAVYRIIESVAESKASVFITGESGTGKELAAQALHQASPRREQPFVAINCGAIPRELLESQIFGHVRGAFTGAVSNHPGAAKKADGGTLLLDEVCELPLDLQVKLLRFLQTGEISPVGSDQVEKVDIRIIAATNRDPLADVKSGRFREDLYYRLHVVPLELPPLREREEDVVLLAEYFLQRFNNEESKNFSGFAPDVLQLFRRYEWPGNVRQLENIIHQIVVLHNDSYVKISMLPEQIVNQPPQTTETEKQPMAAPAPAESANSNQIEPLWQIEKNAILSALQYTQQDVVKAASLLEVSPSTLYRKLQAWKSEK